MLAGAEDHPRQALEYLCKRGLERRGAAARGFHAAPTLEAHPGAVVLLPFSRRQGNDTQPRHILVAVCIPRPPISRWIPRSTGIRGAAV